MLEPPGAPQGDTTGVHRVILDHINPVFKPLVLTGDDANDVRVVAEVVAVLS